MRTLYGALAALAIIAGVLTAAAAVAWATTTSFQPAHQRITTSNQNPRREPVKRRTIAAPIALLAISAAACTSSADRVSGNLSTAADNFEINRRIVFYNGITDTYMLTVEGRCSLGNNDSPGQLTVTCKLGPDQYKKHFLGLSDNVTYFVEQTDPADADEYRYRVIFRPESVLPDPEIN